MPLARALRQWLTAGQERIPSALRSDRPERRTVAAARHVSVTSTDRCIGTRSRIYAEQLSELQAVLFDFKKVGDGIYGAIARLNLEAAD